MTRSQFYRGSCSVIQSSLNRLGIIMVNRCTSSAICNSHLMIKLAIACKKLQHILHRTVHIICGQYLVL